MMLADDATMSANTRRIMLDVLRGDDAFVAQACDMVTRAMKRQVSTMRVWEEQARAVVNTADAGEDAVPWDMSEVPRAPRGLSNDDWEAFLVECRQMMDQLQALRRL